MRVALFFRVIELDSGRWACRFGRTEYDTHCDISQALDHITTLAREHRPAEVMVHHLDGSIDRLGSV